MMKTNLAKKQLTMLTLVLALALAVYLNWNFASNENKVGGDDTVETSSNSDDKHYGDALFVSSTESDPAQYFAEARLNRETSRAEALDTLQKALQQTDLTEAEKNNVMQQLASISASIAIESDIESLVKAKGFKDCVAYINGDKINVVVQANGTELTVSEVSQIKEIVLGQFTIPVQNITIMEIK